MLAKLIKLDLRFAYKQFLMMAALLLLVGILGPVLNISVLKFGLPLIFTITFSVVPVLCVWLVVQHFQRNLFGNEGYLMFSLPVSAGQLLLSKVITTVLWFNMMVFSALGLIILLLRPQASLLSIMADLLTWEAIREGLRALLLINVNVLPLILAIFMGISLGTVVVRNKKIGSFWGTTITIVGIALFVWCCVKLSAWAYLDLTSETQVLISVTVAASQWVNIATSAVFCTLFFYLTTHIMRHRLNLG